MAADLWALGCIVYELFAGKSPFRGQNAHEVYERILRGDLVFSSDFPELAKDLCIALLQYDETKRLGLGKEGMRKLKEHPFFCGVDFAALYHVPVPEDKQVPDVNYTTISELKLIQDYFKAPDKEKEPKRLPIKAGTL